MTAPASAQTLFPVFLDLRAKTVLVIGGGGVANRKIAGLLAAGADVWVAAPELSPDLQTLVEARQIRHKPCEFEAGLLEADGPHRIWLVIAATDQHDVNAHVADAARVRGIWANVVDDVELTAFHMPARVERGPLQIAISSGGAAPMLARHVRERLEAQFDDAYGALAQLFQDLRGQIRATFPDLSARRAFFDASLRGEALHLMRCGDVSAARENLLGVMKMHLACPQAETHFSVSPSGETHFSVSPSGETHFSVSPSGETHFSVSPSGETQSPTLDAKPAKQSLQPVRALGRVALVGAGPGDAGLLTLRALRLLNLADVILSDQLVSKDVLALARRDAEVIFVGKKGGAHCTPQDEIHRHMLNEVRDGKFVVRLKGGDPFVFGRGGEELEFLQAHDIKFEVVPGITAAIACAAYSGIPLTHRDYAQSVRFVTAHCKLSLDNLDWAGLAQERQTLAVYMGVSGLGVFERQLIAHGRGPDTPFALIENGTRPNQRVLTGNLRDLAQIATEQQVQAPSLLLIGEVTRLAHSLHWFGAGAPVIGTRIKKRAPSPGAVSTLTVPPNTVLTKLNTICSPKPEPPRPRLVVKKGSKIRFAVALSMPQPLSLTQSEISLVSAHAAILTSPTSVAVDASGSNA
jgi:uroporphyrin-III C-methyltransferase / precorrin-2 dehydrogenase / sirohydrochlorin ferrochelatase